MKTIFCILITCIFLITGTSISIATTITVDDSSGADYSKIQDAINNATAGDIILVYPGNYTENVDVNKSLMIISQSGNPDDTIVQAANPTDHIFDVTADNVNISGFSITNSQSTGIYLNMVKKCSVTNNRLSKNYRGIHLFSSNYNILKSNTANSNAQYGIFFELSNNNILKNNIASDNFYGVYLSHSGGNELSNNAISNNWHGIYLRTHSNGNILSNNMASPNYLHDIYIEVDSSRNVLSNNTGDLNIVGISRNASFLSPLLTAIALLMAFLVFRGREQK